MASDQALRDLILASNPIGYYPLDEVAYLGHDLSALANHGSQSGSFNQQSKSLSGMDLVMTKPGSAGLMVIPDRAEYRGGTITIEMVVADVGDSNTVWLERGSLGRNFGVQNISSSQQPGIQPSISGFIGSAANTVRQAGAHKLPSLAHVVMLFDSGQLRVATNRFLLDGSTVVGTSTQGDAGNTPIHVFSRSGAINADGYMAHLAIYNRGLTKEEISARGELLFGDISMKPLPCAMTIGNEETAEQCAPPIDPQGQPLYPALPITPSLAAYDAMMMIIPDGRSRPMGYIENLVTVNGEGVSRRVLCLDQAGNLVADTRSSASGVYRFDNLWLERRYMLIAQDDPEYGPADYNAVAADYQKPTPYPPINR
ncbi:hypothetical protein [Aeromonas molluscorum]